jgi:hypothetical protein
MTVHVGSLHGRIRPSRRSGRINALPEDSEFLVLETRGRDAHWVAGETHAEPPNELQELTGRPVAVGPYPPWLADTTDVISAVVPDEDGVVTRGIY